MKDQQHIIGGGGVPIYHGTCRSLPALINDPSEMLGRGGGICTSNVVSLKASSGPTLVYCDNRIAIKVVVEICCQVIDLSYR